VYLHHRCGHQFTPAVSCDACGEAITLADVDVRPGPGARRGPGTRVLAQVLAGRAQRASG